MVRQHVALTQEALFDGAAAERSEMAGEESGDVLPESVEEARDVGAIRRQIAHEEVHLGGVAENPASD